MDERDRITRAKAILAEVGPRWRDVTFTPIYGPPVPKVEATETFGAGDGTVIQQAKYSLSWCVLAESKGRGLALFVHDGYRYVAERMSRDEYYRRDPLARIQRDFEV